MQLLRCFSPLVRSDVKAAETHGSSAFTCDSVECHEATGDGCSELIFLLTDSRPYGALLNDVARAPAPTLWRATYVITRAPRWSRILLALP